MARQLRIPNIIVDSRCDRLRKHSNLCLFTAPVNIALVELGCISQQMLTVNSENWSPANVAVLQTSDYRS